MAARPNILLIHADQLRFDCLGVNGHPLVQTPNLDRLAADGANFRHAYTPAPICSPARASLLTGQWSFQHGCVSTPDTEIYKPAREDLPVFSSILADAGYTLGWVGKFHREVTGDPISRGFTDYIPESAYDAWRQARGHAPKVRKNGWFGEVDMSISPEDSRLAWGAVQTVGLLEDYAGKGDPFFLRWDPSEPHLPNVVPEPYASQHDPASVEPWVSFPDTLEGKPYIQAQQRRTWDIDSWTWDDWAPIVARYLGEVSLLDAQVGVILDRLEELHLTENTMVIFSTDHGDLCGAHGMIDKHFVMYDDITRVPLIVRFPGRIEGGVSCDSFVSHEIDIASTILAAAGLDAPSSFQGRSLIETASGTDPSPRQDIFSAWHGSQLGAFTQRMIRDYDWKYVWNATCEDELYNLAEDPGELNNLAREAPAVLLNYRKRLIGWMESLGDPALNLWTRAAMESGRKL
jgi:arylsulfatase A-like enzyme